MPAGNASHITYRCEGICQRGFVSGLIFILRCLMKPGRPVSRVTNADIFTQDAFHGIKDDGSYYYPLNSTVKLGSVSYCK